MLPITLSNSLFSVLISNMLLLIGILYYMYVTLTGYYSKQSNFYNNSSAVYTKSKLLNVSNVADYYCHWNFYLFKSKFD